MDPRTHLHAVTLLTLQAHSFSRSSLHATNVLTDLLARYLDIVAVSCAQYAEHAGRDSAGINIHDVIAALEDLGMGVDELGDFAEGEGRELRNYKESASSSSSHPLSTGLPALREYLQDGIRQDHSDATILTYERLPSPTDDGDNDGDDEDDQVSSEDEDEIGFMSSIRASKKVSLPPLPPSPTAILPLSPISNPAASPPPTPRKRPRKLTWNAPDHVPDFLPPFPGQGPSAETEEQTATDGQQEARKRMRSPSPLGHKKAPPRNTNATSNTVSDYRNSIPYSSSSLASVPEWHLPPSPSRTSPPPSSSTHLPLLAAYGVLQADTGPQQPSSNHARIRIANVLASASATRYTAPDTLFASLETPALRFPAPLPSHAIPIDPASTLPLPATASRPVATDPPLMATPPYLYSLVPTLARHILTPPVLARTTRLPPPPPLMNTGTGAGTPVTYKRPIHAPWNRQAAAAAEDPPAIADAVLYATWDWDSRSPSVPLRETKRGKTVISLRQHPKMEAADGR